MNKTPVYIELQRAILKDDLKYLETCLGDINDVNTTWASGIGVLHYYIGKAKDLTMNPEKVIDILIKYGVDINLQNSTGTSPLHFCVYHSNVEIAKILIQKGATIDIQDENGNTPLWRAVMDYRGEESLLDVIKILIENRADPDKDNYSGNSPRKIVLEAHNDIPIVGDPIEWDLQPHLNW